MKRVVFSIAMICLLSAPAAADTAWRGISLDKSLGDLKCVAVDIDCPDVIYLGTTEGLYRTEDRGTGWGRIAAGWGRINGINQIYVKGGTLILASDEGLYVSKDSGKSWRRFLGEVSRSRVFSVAVLNRDEPVIFALADEGLFRCQAGERRWRRVFTSGIEDENGEVGAEEVETNGVSLRTLAASFNNNYIYLGTDDGVYITKDMGATFTRLTDEGLACKSVIALAESPYAAASLYAVTESGIYCFDEKWDRLESTAYFRDVRSIAFDLDPKDSIWLATRRKLYKSVYTSSDTERIALEAINTLDYFDDEPTIKEVQEAAVRYAEVHPDKIANWRRRAGMSAVLPRLSLGVDRDSSDTYEIYTSSKSQYAVEGPIKNSDGWDITFTWDLGDLIWNGDQTLIDVRSKLMVQLRDDILDEVTGYYFERRRLQVELLESPLLEKAGRIKKELRVQELSANLDALTGGYFSLALEKRGLD